MIVQDRDDVVQAYTNALDGASTLRDLRRATGQFREVASDAFDVANAMTDDDLRDFRDALRKERQGRFMGKRAAKRFGPVLMPSMILKVALVAEQFGTPWGLAYNQLKKASLITVSEGVARANF